MFWTTYTAIQAVLTTNGNKSLSLDLISGMLARVIGLTARSAEHPDPRLNLYHHLDLKLSLLF